VACAAWNPPSTEDAVAAARYESSIHPVNRLSGSVTREAGMKCGKSAKRVFTLIWPSSLNSAGNSAMRRSKFQL
jgi:hypothetical protein